jgi:hypothetical protein
MFAVPDAAVTRASAICTVTLDGLIPMSIIVFVIALTLSARNDASTADAG